MPKSVLLPGKSVYDYDPTRGEFSLKEARAEYSRLRKIAEKRLKRMAESPYGKSAAYRRYKDAFEPLPRSASEERVRKKLSEVARFTEKKLGSISGAREVEQSQIEALQEHGYDWINKDNIQTFNDYMARIMKFTAAKNYDSEEIVDLVHDAMDAELDPEEVAEDFEDYLQGVKEIPSRPDSDEDVEEALEEIRQQSVPQQKKVKEPKQKKPKKPAEPKSKAGRKKKR